MLQNLDAVIFAIGRQANTRHLGLENAGIQLDDKGNIIADEFETTSIPHIFAIGDVCGKMLLTPVAVAAGRSMSDRLFGPDIYKDKKMSYENIPSVVFS